MSYTITARLPNEHGIMEYSKEFNNLWDIYSVTKTMSFVEWLETAAIIENNSKSISIVFESEKAYFAFLIKNS